VLWAGEIPVRYTLIDRLPPLLVRAMWAAQAALVAIAACGLFVVARLGQRRAAVLLAVPLVYVTVVHLPLFTEPRQTLPVKPIVLVLATVAAGALVQRKDSVIGRAG
jgi:hypothetical protein